MREELTKTIYSRPLYPRHPYCKRESYHKHSIFRSTEDLVLYLWPHRLYAQHSVTPVSEVLCISICLFCTPRYMSEHLHGSVQRQYTRYFLGTMLALYSTRTCTRRQLQRAPCLPSASTRGGGLSGGIRLDSPSRSCKLFSLTLPIDNKLGFCDS